MDITSYGEPFVRGSTNNSLTGFIIIIYCFIIIFHKFRLFWGWFVCSCSCSFFFFLFLYKFKCLRTIFFFFFFVLPENPKHFKKHWKDLVSSFFFPSSVLVYLLQDLKYTQPSALNGDIQKCLAILFPAAILKHALIYRNSLRASQKIPNMFCLGVHLKSIGTSMFPRLQILHGCISPIRSAVTLFHSQNEPF